jgi:hypothetical protein
VNCAKSGAPGTGPAPAFQLAGSLNKIIAIMTKQARTTAPQAIMKKKP